jgi:hypothetical protein
MEPIMRLNIYSQELILNGDPKTLELGYQKAGTDITYAYVRMHFHSSDRLHQPPLDDDRSAITFWLPKSKDKRFMLRSLFLRMAEMISMADEEIGLD